MPGENYLLLDGQPFQPYMVERDKALFYSRTVIIHEDKSVMSKSYPKAHLAIVLDLDFSVSILNSHRHSGHILYFMNGTFYLRLTPNNVKFLSFIIYMMSHPLGIKEIKNLKGAFEQQSFFCLKKVVKPYNHCLGKLRIYFLFFSKVVSITVIPLQYLGSFQF